MTSIPASRSARATTLAPRSCPSRPIFETNTRMRPVFMESHLCPWICCSALDLDLVLPQISRQPEPERFERRRRLIGWHQRRLCSLKHLPADTSTETSASLLVGRVLVEGVAYQPRHPTKVRRKRLKVCLYTLCGAEVGDEQRVRL